MCPTRSTGIEHVRGGSWIAHDGGGLAKINEHKRRKGNVQPGITNGMSAEMSHVRVQRFTSRNRQHDRTERYECRGRFRDKEHECIVRIERRHDDGRRDCRSQSHPRHQRKPCRHDRTEQTANTGRSTPLIGEQRDQNHQCDRNNQRCQTGVFRADIFDSAQH